MVKVKGAGSLFMPTKSFLNDNSCLYLLFVFRLHVSYISHTQGRRLLILGSED